MQIMFTVIKISNAIYKQALCELHCHFVLSFASEQRLRRLSLLLNMDKILLFSLAVVFLAAGTQSLSCECGPTCTPVKDLNCKGGTVADMCGCCDVCAKVADDVCGGPYDMMGRCDQGLRCDILDPSDINSHGECVKVDDEIIPPLEY